MLLTAGVVGLAIGAAVIGATWTLSGGAPPPKPVPAVPFTLKGSMTVSDLVVGTPVCFATHGYNDIAKGTPVTVYDSAGQVVAKGALGDGQRVGNTCEFGVTVQGVPEGPKFYQVEVSHRGKITLSAEDAKAGRFAASLG